MFYLCHNCSLWSTWYISYPWLMKLSTQAMFIFFFFSYCISPQTNKLYNFWFLFIFFFIVSLRFASLFFLSRASTKYWQLFVQVFRLHTIYTICDYGVIQTSGSLQLSMSAVRTDSRIEASTHTRTQHTHVSRVAFATFMRWNSPEYCVSSHSRYPSPALSTSLLIEWAVPSPPPPLLHCDDSSACWIW